MQEENVFWGIPSIGRNSLYPRRAVDGMILLTFSHKKYKYLWFLREMAYAQMFEFWTPCSYYENVWALSF